MRSSSADRAIGVRLRPLAHLGARWRRRHAAPTCAASSAGVGSCRRLGRRFARTSTRPSTAAGLTSVGVPLGDVRHAAMRVPTSLLPAERDGRVVEQSHAPANPDLAVVAPRLRQQAQDAQRRTPDAGPSPSTSSPSAGRRLVPSSDAGDGEGLRGGPPRSACPLVGSGVRAVISMRAPTPRRVGRCVRSGACRRLAARSRRRSARRWPRRRRTRR